MDGLNDGVVTMMLLAVQRGNLEINMRGRGGQVAGEADIDDYKRWIGLPSHLAQNPAYSASNVLEWIKVDKFDDYLTHRSKNTLPDASKRIDTGFSSSSGIIEIPESDSEASSPPIVPVAHIPHTVDKKHVLREIVNLCTSDSDRTRNGWVTETELMPPGPTQSSLRRSPSCRLCRRPISQISS
ncbi:hypothetical protein B0H13DRAFT_1851159 [Mycena leptocephala]|nr:hypothetical protein B0H13DRAFT_1851159 [Mycena leptocephala]